MAGQTQGDGPPRRRIRFIQRAFQLRFILRVTVVAVLGTALTGGLLYVLADQEFGRTFYSVHYQARSSWELLLPAVLISSFVSMALVAAAAVVLTLDDSHRIGGPLYRFQLNLKAIGEGDLVLVTCLRDGDELKPLTDAMNQMTGALRDRVRRARQAHEQLALALAEITGASETGEVVSADLLARAARAEADLRGVFGEFRVDA